MKKTIIAVVVLVAALAGLKFFASKQQEAPSAQPASQAKQEQAGVALPSEAAKQDQVDTSADLYPQVTTGSYDVLVLPEAAMSVKGACEEGSVKNILENHNKTWGYFVGRRIGMDGKRSQEIYDGIADYYACVAVSRHDSSACAELPGEFEKDGVKVDPNLSPLGYCRSKAATLMFKAFVAGKTADSRNCMAYLSEWDGVNLSKISPPDFCAAAGKGPEAGLGYVKEKMPNVYPMAEKAMGFSRRACGDDPVCLANNGTWEGIRTGDASRCARDAQPHCAALARKDITACATILSDLSKKYCGYYKDLLKAGGGYAGLTPDEVKADLQLKAQKKAEEAKQRKEQEAATKATNDKVRKLMGRQQGGE